ncbi:hypothetical protein CJ030_MR4G006348 [Morella rubra]|uniref:Uncharacterized protein n=1 Tax=Morella rubra TaxID=262757 RepID=A0A6A1VZD0_9ROSI|nr:hypothetical protein CJ030_MR4G006348 [Morella rubra]
MGKFEYVTFLNHLFLNLMKNEDDEWVKKVVATPSQEIQEEAAEEEKDEEDDPEEVEPVIEDRADEEITLPTSLLLDLRDQLFSIHVDLWIGLEEIKSIPESHTVELSVSIHEARLTHNFCTLKPIHWESSQPRQQTEKRRGSAPLETYLFAPEFIGTDFRTTLDIARTTLYDWRQSFITKMTELTTTQNQMTDMVSRTASDVTQTCDIFINKDTDLRPEVESWVKWFSHSYTTFLRKYRIDPGHCPV